MSVKISNEIKAVFLDYTGTMVREDDQYTMSLVKHFVANSDIKDPKLIYGKVWELIKKIEWDCYKDSFIKKDEMVDRILDYSVKKFGLKDDLDEIHSIWRDSWIHAPLFDDVKAFMDACPLPIYIVTNDDYQYVVMSMEEKGLSPAGIISAEHVKACKPHVEILEEGLKVAGVNPENAVLIGDSESSDVVCANEAGVTPILLDRKNKCTRDDICVVHSLQEVLDILS